MQAPLNAWGRLSRDEHVVVALRHRAAARAQIVASARPGIAYGNGRSYGDEALNRGGTAWLTRGLDRFLAFDTASGVLRCEAGVTLADLIAVALPRGWFVPVTPGTQFVTLGGAVANDVHGKNHHRAGTLGEHVVALTLVRSDGEQIACGPRQRPEWFAATIGGLGLTGVIVDVTLQLRRVAGPWIDTRTETFESLDEFFALSARDADAVEYSVAWVDCGGGSAGRVRGAFFSGDHADERAPLPPERARSARWLPTLRWVRPATTRAFNALYFRRCAAKPARALQSYRAFFYPLDGILEWNRLYGQSGFYQYQCVVPQAVQRDATDALLRAVAASGSASFLSVLKTFGERRAPGLLSFPMAGTTLALDFPNDGAATQRLFDRLNAIVAAAGGRLYAAKDALMPAALFRQGYPRLDEFLRFRDPGISSEMSRRLLGH
ncbi:MAG TPA: FAD-binding oxidoreductase [Burkholderiaceae bacterium]|nr:FAD-binding oxidoreductase [Burkholderiaceae bacterium]